MIERIDMGILQEISLNLNLVGVTQMNLINILKQSRELNDYVRT